jgi:hypothetical protein
VTLVGDELLTGPGASLVFVMGDSAFHLRQNSRLKVEGDTGGVVVNALRLLTGGVISVWGKGPQRKISTPTATAGIRGTGVYAEVFPEQDTAATSASATAWWTWRPAPSANWCRPNTTMPIGANP